MEIANLGSLTTLMYGKSLSGYKENNPVENPFRVYGTNGPIGWTSNYLFKGPSIVVGRKGAYREVHWAKGNSWVIDTAYSLSLNNSKINLRWLYWKLKTININRLDSGSAIPSTKKEDFYSIKISYPSLVTQKKISNILDTYDNLIENNNRRIQLLEESARLLYKQWFVHFRFPGHENTKIVDGVPEGWERLPLKHFFNIKHGFAFKGAYFSKNITNRILLTPGNFKIGGGIKLNKIKYYSESGPLSDDYILIKNDLLITMTDLSKTSATIGYPMLVPENKKRIFLHNQRLGKVVPKNKDCFSKFFFYNLLQDYRYRAFIVGSATGTSVKHTSPGKILDYKATIPKNVNHPLIFEFNQISQTIQSQINTLYNQIQILTEARDLLLPRLMSGEVEV